MKANRSTGISSAAGLSCSAFAFLERVATADACAVVPYTSPRYFTARLSACEDTDTSMTEAE